jgi:uncharacterized protein DUF6132
MQGFIKKYSFAIIGVVIGAIGGYVYWAQVGCTGNSCPIYSVWWRSTLYGAVFGGLLGSIAQDLFKKKNKTPIEPESPDQ